MVGTSILARPLAAPLLAGLVVASCGSLFPQGGVTDLTGPWQAEPYTVAQSILVEAERQCRVGFEGMIKPDNALIVVDARGGGTLMLAYAGPTSSSFCELQANAKGELTAGGGGSQEGGGPLQPPLPDALRSDGGSTSSGGGGGGGGLFGGPRSSITGQAGALIHTVEVVTPSGRRLLASIGRDGWFAAWWPSDEMDIQVNGYDANGNLVGSLTPGRP